MASSKSSTDDLIGVISESWVHIATGSNSGSSTQSLIGGMGGGCGTPAAGTITPQLTPEDCIRLLREAQRESNNSSARVSPRGSPKSPPNSPVSMGTPLIMEWQSYYVNHENKDAELYSDWSSRPDQVPPKNWSFRPSSKRDALSLRYARVGNTSVFSRRGLCALFLTNLLSLLLGTGVGIWLSKHGFFTAGAAVGAIKMR